MSNLIERQAAIDAVENYFKNYPTADRKKQLPSCSQVCDVLSKIPSAQQWIPVSERLPEERKKVMTYQPEIGSIRIGEYIGNGKWREVEYHNLMELPVTHWRSLPEPPKEKEANNA